MTLDKRHRQVHGGASPDIQLEVYPSVAGQSRRLAYPELLHSGRSYTEAWEKLDWCLEEALAYLGRYRVHRKVSASGKVSVYDRGLAVGKEYGGQMVEVRLDAASREWVFSAPDGRPLRRRQAEELTTERIRGLNIARRRGSS